MGLHSIWLGTSHRPPPPSPAALSAAAVGRDTKAAGLAVLVVDDEPLIRWSLRQGLANRGHVVAEADCGAVALDRISGAREPFDVVILDYRLPDRQDLSLLADVRLLAPTSAVIMMTAFGDEAMRSQAFVLGAHAVVDKPFQVHAFIELVESARPN